MGTHLAYASWECYHLEKYTITKKAHRKPEMIPAHQSQGRRMAGARMRRAL